MKASLPRNNPKKLPGLEWTKEAMACVGWNRFIRTSSCPHRAKAVYFYRP